MRIPFKLINSVGADPYTQSLVYVTDDGNEVHVGRLNVEGTQDELTTFLSTMLVDHAEVRETVLNLEKAMRESHKGER